MNDLPAFVKLATIIRECEEWNDNAERLAVRLIRECKEAEGMEPETERADYATATALVGNFPTLRGSFAFGIALAQATYSRELVASVPDNREPFAFFRAKLANVGGKILKIKWAV